MQEAPTATKVATMQQNKGKTTEATKTQYKK